MKLVMATILSGVLLFAGCGLLDEGEPVDARTGVIGVWQSDLVPERIMEFKTDGQGQYAGERALVDQRFRYAFSDDDTIQFTFENGQKMNMDVRATTRYLWFTHEGEVERFHKYE